MFASYRANGDNRAAVVARQNNNTIIYGCITTETPPVVRVDPIAYVKCQRGDGRTGTAATIGRGKSNDLRRTVNHRRPRAADCGGTTGVYLYTCVRYIERSIHYEVNVCALRAGAVAVVARDSHINNAIGRLVVTSPAIPSNRFRPGGRSSPLCVFVRALPRATYTIPAYFRRLRWPSSQYPSAPDGTGGRARMMHVRCETILPCTRNPFDLRTYVGVRGTGVSTNTPGRL